VAQPPRLVSNNSITMDPRIGHLCQGGTPVGGRRCIPPRALIRTARSCLVVLSPFGAAKPLLRINFGKDLAGQSAGSRLAQIAEMPLPNFPSVSHARGNTPLPMSSARSACFPFPGYFPRMRRRKKHAIRESFKFKDFAANSRSSRIIERLALRRRKLNTSQSRPERSEGPSGEAFDRLRFVATLKTTTCAIEQGARSQHRPFPSPHSIRPAAQLGLSGVSCGPRAQWVRVPKRLRYRRILMSYWASLMRIYLECWPA